VDATLLAATFLGYFTAAVAYVAALYDAEWKRWCHYGLFFGWVSQTIWLAREAFLLHFWPLETLYGWIAGFIWIAVIIYAVYQRFRPTLPLGGFLMPVLVLIWMGSQALAKQPAVLPARVSGPILTIHIVSAMLAYVAFLLAAVFSIMYSEKERELKRKRVRLFYYQLPSLDVMDFMSSRLVLAGLVFLTLTLIMGAVWSRRVWGYYWSWSAQSIWSTLTWMVYAVYEVLRQAGWRGHRASIYTMAAFLFVLVNLFIIGVMFHGAHFYNG
jgi:ABC-type transport system involved in cytochrome c biogenesis permease subunit